MIEVLEHRDEEEAFEASKNYGLDPDTSAEMTGVDSAVELVEVVEHPNSTVEKKIDREEANNVIGDRTLFRDLPHKTDNKPSLGTTIGADEIFRSHQNKATRESYNAYFPTNDIVA